MVEKIYIVTLENNATGKVLMRKDCFTRVDVEVFARDFQHFEKYGNTVYIRVEKFQLCVNCVIFKRFFLGLAILQNSGWKSAE